jgi:hypothetical protein
MSSFEYFIKKTDNETLDIDELLNVIELVDKTTISKSNISLILKLISNLTHYEKYIEFDIYKIFDENKHILNNGDIISFVKIYCSNKYNNPNKAIELIILYNVHKTSSYLPLFSYLIKTNNYELIKELYYQYIKQNKLIIQHNQEIKEYNYKTKLYNSNTKLLKQKYNEFNVILQTIKTIDIEENKFKTFDLFSCKFDEIQHKMEQNLICINTILIDILKIAINNNDNNLINDIIIDCELNQNIIDLILNYFSDYSKTSLDINNKCIHCNKHICYNVISNEHKKNILAIIQDKIINITHRNNNGVIIDAKNKEIIKSKFNELNKLLDNFDFYLIIDGGNLGYFSSNTNDINIVFMRNYINEILKKTNKHILLIIHDRHKQTIKQLKIDNKNLIIYFTPQFIDDDLFWLYSSIYSNAYILTNDQSRNNSCMFSYQFEIKKWLKHFQININNNLIISDINKYDINNVIINSDNTHIIVNNNTVFCL